MPFPITCTACQKTFSIADDVYERKVKGRVVTIKCKQCQAGIRVDGTKDTPVFSAADVPANVSGSAALPLVEAAPPPAPPSSPIEAPAPPIAPVVALAEPLAPPAIAAAAPAPSPAAPAPVATVTAKATTVTAPKAAAPAAWAPKVESAPKAAVPAATPKAVTSPATAGAGKAGTAPIAARAPLGAARTPLGAASRGTLNPGAKQSATALATKAATATSTPIAAPIAAAPPLVTPAPAAVATPEPPPAVPEMLWAVDYPDGQDRELTLAEIKKELTSGAINPTSLVWREGMAAWLELGQVAELQPLTVAAPTASAPEPPPAPPTPPVRAKAPSAPTFNLPAARAKATSAPAFDLPKPLPPSGLPNARPPAPSSPLLDFDLQDAIGSAPQAPIPRSPTMAGIGEPLPPSPFDAPAAAFPSSPVMVPAPALAAPFATQSFARQALPATAHAVAPPLNIPDWPQKSRAPLIIGGLVAVLAVAGGAWFFTQSDDKLPPPVPISALPPTAPNHVSSAAPTGTTETGAAPAESPNQGSRAALEPPGSAPTATPNAGFAELFASGARHADEKAGATASQRFDPTAANKALASASFDTAKCRENGGPSGTATIVVTFEPSGKVASATVSDPPFAGTSSGTCISAAMKRASVPPFSGLPGTVTKVISIQ
jgi:hypothetical protein